jgi:two-component system phosphate regulon sensor histidine kinase PhoR
MRLAETEQNLNLVMANMSEGLLLLDRKGIVLLMNQSAARFLAVGDEPLVGKHIFTANRESAMLSAVYDAMGGKSGHAVLEIGGSTVELRADPVLVDKVIRGAVVVLRDVTERHAAEKMRREFSANVSHELKTPLTAISGYAELLKAGMVKAEDGAPFAGKIYDEAQRLISLTEDILRLSRLDEGGAELPVEAIALTPLVQSAADRLADKARKYEVTLSVSGGDGRILGNPGLLDEMIYNLCDNAIKYNKPGGRVEMRVRTVNGKVVLEVADTGVGIPREHQGRVFERFYRVDKSHSRATGGTGLGLSIVKNGAAFHKAGLELDSEAGKGTTVRLLFNSI